jgi:hypothetical protein
MSKRGQSPYSSTNSSGGFGSNSTYVPTRAAPSYDARSNNFSQAEADRNAATSNGAAKVFKKKGMQLGGSKKGDANKGLQEALGGLSIDEEIALPSPSSRDQGYQEEPQATVASNGAPSRAGGSNPFGDVEEQELVISLRSLSFNFELIGFFSLEKYTNALLSRDTVFTYK